MAPGTTATLLRSQHLAKFFVVDEEEHFILFDRTAKSSAKLITLEGWRTDGLIEEVPGVEIAVAQILECVAVPLIGPGGGHDVDRASGALAVLGAVGV